MQTSTNQGDKAKGLRTIQDIEADWTNVPLDDDLEIDFEARVEDKVESVDGDDGDDIETSDSDDPDGVSIVLMLLTRQVEWLWH